ncbi:hypothetical protein [uncultured Paraglaciecola sp.]|uniref:hypothetical protein n=1 Tax=uncultured Paraglaciecola sp. TaxID=1765024 RepID=UPI00262A6947|nr:hypothetical protein [uncultured Paraglaciecola sp.]
MAISIKHDIRKLQEEMGRTRKSQVPFAIRLTLNQLARNSKKVIDKQILSRIDRPTRFTQRAIATKNATRRTMTSRVMVKDRRNENRLLEHLFTGGGRTAKNAEGTLKGLGVLPSGKFIVPGKFAPRDSFGNIRRAFINKLVKYFQTFRPDSNTTSTLSPGVWIRRFDRGQKKTRKNQGKTGSFEFFVVHKQVSGGGKSRRGKKRKAPEPVLLFVDRPRYRRLFNMEETARQVILRDLAIEFRKAYSRAVSTAR